MTAQPLPDEEQQSLIDLELDWFQPIALPLEAYTEFARQLTEQLDELERRFPSPAQPTTPRR